MPSCGLTIVSHGASPNDPPDAYEGVRCGSFASKGLPSCVPGRCRKTAERTVPDMAKTNTMTANVSLELACVEYVSDYYAERGEIWYPWEG